MPEPQLVIMAAGIGSRYGGLKQIDPVGPSGEILIDYAIYDAFKAGFRRIVFIIRKHFEQDFFDKIGYMAEKRAEVRYAYQEIDALPEGLSAPSGRTKPWGTGHALLVAAPFVDAPCAAINADDFYGASSFATLYRFLRTASDSALYDYAMIGFTIENTLTEHGHVARGVCVTRPDGCLESVVERTKIRMVGGGAAYTENGADWVPIPPNSNVSMNMWGFTPSFYRELDTRFRAWFKANATDPKAEFFVPTVVDSLVREHRARVKVLPTSNRWYGVTYQADKPIVAEAIRGMIREGVYPPRLWG